MFLEGLPCQSARLTQAELLFRHLTAEAALTMIRVVQGLCFLKGRQAAKGALAGPLREKSKGKLLHLNGPTGSFALSSDLGKNGF